MYAWYILGGGYISVRRFFCIIFLLSALCCISAQTEKPRVAVATFDYRNGVTRDESEFLTDQFIIRIANTGVVTVVDRDSFDKVLEEESFRLTNWSKPENTSLVGKAVGADFIIRGIITKMENRYYFTATMINASTAEVLAPAQADNSSIVNLVQHSLSDAVTMMADKMRPPPVSDIGKFVGRWRSVSTNGKLTCELIMEQNGSIVVQRYDSGKWIKKTRGLRYVWEDEFQTGEGSGYYSADNNGKMTVNLQLRKVSSDYAGINISAQYRFVGSNSFVLNNGLPCYTAGDNVDYYKTFLKY
jgi:TolB-like protein